VKTGPGSLVTSIDTRASLPRTSTMAGAPVDISAAMAWAAKYVERKGFWVRHPPRSHHRAPALVEGAQDPQPREGREGQFLPS
jgi:hypothetical protein